MITKQRLPWILGAFLLLSTQALATSMWVETGDAGDIPGTAQITFGPGPLDVIAGHLDEDPVGLGIDMFRIMITNPLGFSARTVEAVDRISDPQLFLFDLLGAGVYSNDDDDGGLFGSQSLLPAAHLMGPTTAGWYNLAIGWFDNEPINAGGSIFFNGIGTNGPDLLAGGAQPMTGWNGDVINRLDLPTLYYIELTGASFAAVPEPATLTLLSLGLLGIVAWKRPRRNR